MNVHIVLVGKTDNKELSILIDDYLQRINFYVKSETEIIISKKKTNEEVELIKAREASTIISKFKTSDYIVLLDETGNKYSSLEFAKQIIKINNLSFKRLVFVIGGAYGVSSALMNRANLILSISKMTFTHQMVRLILLEQIYRAYSIINNSKYHH